MNRLIILISVIPTHHVFTSICVVSDVGPESEMCCGVQEVQQDHEGGDEQNENVDDEVFDRIRGGKLGLGRRGAIISGVKCDSTTSREFTFA